jgi:dienelactone hydrolase
MERCDQVSALQARLREVESRLEIYQAGHGARLARYREAYSEAAWEDVFSE